MYLNRKKIVLTILTVAMVSLIQVNPLAANLNQPSEKGKEQSTQQTKKVAKQVNTQDIFTGSTPLVQYLYSEFSSSPSVLYVPVQLFSSYETEARFEELGQAAIEAYIQNGLTDFVEDFQYQYTDGDSNITMQISYANKDEKNRATQGDKLGQTAEAILEAVLQTGMSTRAMAEALSNYVAQNVLYDFNGFSQYQAGKNVDELQTSYAALVGRKAICQGFARGYKLLCDKAGIPCVVIFGKTKQFNTAHAWNRIYLDGKWETVDTSNPQLVINRVGSFCIPKATVDVTLAPDGSKTFVHGKAANYLE